MYLLRMLLLKNNVDYYGNEKYFKPSMECIEQEYKKQTDCYCVNGLSECTTFSGRTDCFDILDTYTNYVNKCGVVGCGLFFQLYSVLRHMYHHVSLAEGQQKG